MKPSHTYATSPLLLPFWLILFWAGTLAPGLGQTSPVYAWTNFVGQPGGIGNADGTGSMARFYSPAGVVVDGTGNIYVADANNNTIRKVTVAGGVTTLAGLAGVSGNTDGSGTAARFNQPYGLAVDTAGNLYVSDSNNSRIRKVTPAGVVTTLAGGSYGSADGTGTAAQFAYPRGLAVDSAGNVFVADQANNAVRKVTSAGVVTTLAGLAGSPGSADGTSSAARFNQPYGVAVDGAGMLFVADSSNHTLRKVTTDGVVTTFAGTAGVSGSADGTGSAARFHGPGALIVDTVGNVYVADGGNNTIRRMTAAGLVTTLAGSGAQGYLDGTGSAAQFFNPSGIALDGAGNLFVSDRGNHTLRKVTAAGVVTTLAGLAGNRGSADGTGSAARFILACAITLDNAGNAFVGDLNQRIKKVNPAGVVTTMAGSSLGSADGMGTAAQFDNPYGVSADTAGNVFVADAGNHTIRKMTPAGVVTTLAGLAGSSGTSDGTGNTARFNGPFGVAVDSAGNVFVADANNRTIRKVTSAGVVTTLAGLAGTVGSTDGTGTAARFYNPSGIALDSAGNLFVSDSYNHTIRKVTPAGAVTTLAGLAGNIGSLDGVGSGARFNYPRGLAVDTVGNVFVADRDNHTIRKVTPAGVVTTVGGLGGVASSTDGLGSSALFSSPYGVAVDSAGYLYVADYNNNRVTKGTPLYAPTITSANTVTFTVGSVGSFAITATGYPAPAFSVMAGSLPSGVTLVANGTLSGTAAAGSAGTYLLTITAGNGVTPNATQNFTLTVLPSIAEAVDATNLVWTTGGDGAWYGQTNTSYDGVDAARSGTIISAQDTWLQTTVTGCYKASFWSKLALDWETGYGWFSFSIDGVVQYWIDNGFDWTLVEVEMGTGNHTLRWAYHQDMGDTGQEAVWLDQVVVVQPTPPVISQQPQDLSAFLGGLATFSVTATGTAPLSYQWRKGVTNLVGSTNSNLMVSGVTSNDAGLYSVVVSNIAGTATSSNALLSIVPVPTIGEALDARNLVWTAHGTFDTTTTNTHDHADAGKFSVSCLGYPMGNYCGDSLETSVVGPVSLTWWWAESIVHLSAPPFSVVASWSLSIDGTGAAGDATGGYIPFGAVEWHQGSVFVPAGIHTLSWSFGTTFLMSGMCPPDCTNIVGWVLAEGYLDGVGLTVIPSINVTGSGQTITNGDATPRSFDGTDYGIAFLGGSSVVRTFMIQNNGTAPLTLTGSPKVGVSGLQAGDFTVTVQPNSPVASGGSATTFQVAFTPSAPGTRTAILSIANDDSTKNPYTYTIQGTGVDTNPPSITCPGNLTLLADANKSSRSNVTFTATATDNVSVTNVICVPPSGSTFPAGTSAVTCTAADSSGNTAQCTFNVVVRLSSTTNDPVNALMPDGTPVGMISTLNVSTPIDHITDVNVTLNIAGSYNGDLYAYLVHDSGFAMLLNRPGRSLGSAYGYSDDGLNVTLDDQAANGDIHLYQNVTIPSGALTGRWAPDGRASSPYLVLDIDAREDLLSVFNGLNPNGAWTLFLADVSSGDLNTLVSWGLEIQGTHAAPTITCPLAVGVSANPGQCYATGVNLGTPTVTGQGVTVTNDAPVLFPVGTTVVTWTATDGLGNAATCPQLVTVTAPAPQPVSDALSTMANTAQVVPVVKLLANDTHPEGKAMHLAGVTASGLGSSVVVTTNNGEVIVTYNPPPNYIGSDSFTYTNADTCGVTAVGTVAVTVTASGNFFNLVSINEATVGADNVVTIVARGIPGAAYALQRADQLSASAAWGDLQARAAGTVGADYGRIVFTFTNPPSPSYYRTLYQGP